MPKHLTLFTIVSFCVGCLNAWSCYPSQRQRALSLSSSCRNELVVRRRLSNIQFLAADDDGLSEGQKMTTGGIKKEVKKLDAKDAVYGVSYIGGDPCGSKYNTDPFHDEPKDDNSFKPGLPDDMRNRIATLAAEKLARNNEER
jgi:hypothetical protein